MVFFYNGLGYFRQDIEKHSALNTTIQEAGRNFPTGFF
jgi:hypothetical protein